MQLHQCEVWLTCDGQPLSEYSTQLGGDDEKTISCFIPSQTGKTFAVHYDNQLDDHVRCSLRMDGFFLGSSEVRSGSERRKDAYRSTPNTESPFQFATLVTTDDDEATFLQDVTNIGEIRVTVHRIHRVKLTKREIQQREKNLKRNGNRRDVNAYKEFPGTGPVHESSKKAGAHCITLGEARPVKASRSTKPSTTKTRVINPAEGPHAVFVFHYRPLAHLQAQGIAPLPLRESHFRSSGPSEVIEIDLNSDDEDPATGGRSGPRKRARIASQDDAPDVKPVKPTRSDEEEDVSVLRSQLQQIKDKLSRIEKNSRDPSGSRPGMVKEEPGASGQMRSGGGVIDLTLSDED
ncbi:hypothetical protein C8Q76DRAFT_725513 [Earliella scabrosa]|nr:hypothetical protein C8Q76DRAFT_725513 [Earliella scabrosa]